MKGYTDMKEMANPMICGIRHSNLPALSSIIRVSLMLQVADAALRFPCLSQQ